MAPKEAPSLEDSAAPIFGLNWRESELENMPLGTGSSWKVEESRVLSLSLGRNDMGANVREMGTLKASIEYLSAASRDRAMLL